MFGREKLLAEIERLESQVLNMDVLNDDMHKQLREVEHSVGLDRLRHEFEIEEARSLGRREGDNHVRDMEKRHADDVIKRLESLNEIVLQHLPQVNVDKRINRKDRDGD